MRGASRSIRRPGAGALALSALLGALVLAPGAQAATSLKVAPGGDRVRPTQPSRGVTRIVGGNATTNGKYPWQALLVVDGDAHPGESVGLCGGSLIHPLIVITAAHCFVEDDGTFEKNLEITVLLGDTEFLEGTEVHEAFEEYANSGYDPDAHPEAPSANDVAFVTLDAPSSLPRILIAGPDERALWEPGRDAYVSGWGTTSEGGEISEILKEARVPIIDDGTCAQPSINGAVGFSATTMLCAGFLAGGTDSCQGDSGGPLQSPIDGGGFRLTGVVSWGIGCARPNKPGVYSRIAGDALAEGIRGFIPFVEELENFSSQYTGIDVFGSGARPPGCGAAEGAVAQAGQAVSTATASQAAATKGSRSAVRSSKRAKKAFKAARRGAKKAKEQGGKARKRAHRRLAKAVRKLKKAKRRARSARRRLNSSNATLSQANGTLAAATQGQVATCE